MFLNRTSLPIQIKTVPRDIAQLRPRPFHELVDALLPMEVAGSAPFRPLQDQLETLVEFSCKSKRFKIMWH